MKKIYSFVLMAMMLLIGTNAWAQQKVARVEKEGQEPVEYTTLQAAVNAVGPNETAKITLLKSITDLAAPVVIPQVATINSAADKVVNRGRQHITLDLAGFDIATASTYNGSAFILLKGELNIIGEGKISREGSHYQGSYGNFSQAAIVVCGADGQKNPTEQNPDRSKQEWSTLTIGPDVTVWADGHQEYNETGTYDGSFGIAIQDISDEDTNGNNSTYHADLNQYIHYENLGYRTYNADCASTYDPMWFRSNLNNSGHKEQGSAFGVKIIVKGTVYGYQRGINIVGHINQRPDTVKSSAFYTGETLPRSAAYPFYTHYYPYVKVEEGAKVYCYEDNIHGGNGGIYGGGWCVIDIYGEVCGQTGALLKGGDVLVYDGNVYSTSSSYNANGNYQSNVAGNAIFVTTDAAYAGKSSVTIDGDSKITGNGGTAITEVLADNSQTTTVQSINIQGGTIEGGDKGAIAVTAGGSSKTTIMGGGVTTPTGDKYVTVNGEDVGLGAVTDNSVHSTTVVVDGKTTVVVSKGAAPTGFEGVYAATKDSVKWKHLDESTTAMAETLAGNKTLKELEINQNYDQTLTIPEGVTLSVEHVVLGENAKIIVAPGAKFIVTGEQGIIAPKTSCIVLQTNGSKQAEFVFNPDVKSNKTPDATVEMMAKAGKVDEYREWHRFAMPVQHIDSWLKSPNWSTYLYAWDYENDDWYKPSEGVSVMVPFGGYTLSPVSDYGEITYTFEGQLIGNKNHTLDFVKEGFNFFGNSYTAYLSVKQLIAQLTEEGSKFEPTIWTWYSNKYHAVPLNALADDVNDEIFTENQRQIKPMQTFILRLLGADEAETELNYASAIWGNPRYADIVNPAPARRVASNDNTFMRISINTSEDNADDVLFMEQGKFSDAFDNGYDASKFMNEQGVNIYATVEGEELSAVATDNVEGKTLSIRTANEAIYTLSFSNVHGAEYAIRDNATNAVIDIVDGATYEFAAQPNSVIESRFEIVNVNKMPTAIDNTEVVKNIKGIYTITGQYVGENFEVLPAGVYVVNGVKIVK